MHHKRKQDGFTLIEVAVAMSTTAILSLGVLLAFSTSGIQDRGAYETTRSQNVCVAMMEQIESMSFSELQLIAGAPLTFPIERWTFVVQVAQITPDLVSIETRARVSSENGGWLRVATLKARKQEV
jgi:Tfp pilus assembly protein PilV